MLSTRKMAGWAGVLLLAGSVWSGVGSLANSVQALKSLLGDTVTEAKSTKQLVREIDAGTAASAKSVREAQMINVQQKQEVAEWKLRRDAREHELQEVKQEIRTARNCLREQRGDVIEPAIGVRCSRADVESDLATLVSKADEIQLDLKQLQELILTGEQASTSMLSDVSAARRKLIADQAWSSRWKTNMHREEIRSLTAAGRSGSSTWELIAAGEDPIEGKKQLVERRLGLAQGEEATDRRWKLWTAGHANAAESVLADADRVLGDMSRNGQATDLAAGGSCK
jgi:hypothetical protein